MRYYDIRISEPNTGTLIVPFPFKSSPVAVSSFPGTTGTPSAIQSNQGDTSYTSFPGHHNPNALDIELQVRNIGYGTIAGSTKQGSFVRIYGVSLPEIGQQFKLTEKNIVIKAGMSKGLPLAKPQQAGVIVSGRIWQALGNWEGVDKTLELMIYEASVNPSNFQFVWQKNQFLIDAIRTTLAGSSLSGFKIVGSISSQLKNNTRTMGATYTSFEEFATAVLNMSKAPEFSGIKTLTGFPYQGVQIFKRPGINARIISTVTIPAGGGVAGEDILIDDKTTATVDSRTPSNPLLLAYTDFIGQPTWIEPVVISFKTVLRADIRVGDYVKFPNDKLGNLFGIITPGATPGQNQSPSRNNLAFESSFFIRSMNHYGRYRSVAASSWVTVFEGIFTQIPKNINQTQIPTTPQGPLGGGGI